MTTANVKARGVGRRNVAVFTRWLHLYLSMVSFALVLFFAATGLTLNHPTWFAYQQRTTERHGKIPAALLHAGSVDAANGINRLGIAELLRQQKGVHGAVTDFRVDDAQVSVSFRAPGYTADAFIDRALGQYDLTIVENGVVAALNDLHKGRDAGRAWSAVIDISAILLVLVSLTGLVLIWFLYRRRTSGLLVAFIAMAAALLIWLLRVP